MEHGGGVMVLCWWHRDLFRIQGTLYQYGYHSMQRYTIPSGLSLVGLSFVFQLDNDPKHTSRLCKGYLTKKERDGVLHQMTWPPQSPNHNPFEMVWDELDRRVKEKQPTSVQHMWEFLQPHGLVFVLTCSVTYGTLYRQVCGLSKSCPLNWIYHRWTPIKL